MHAGLNNQSIWEETKQRELQHTICLYQHEKKEYWKYIFDRICVFYPDCQVEHANYYYQSYHQ